MNELQVERNKLNQRYDLLEHIGGISAVVTLIALGGMLGSIPNSDKKYLKISTAIFGSAGISVVTAYRWCIRIENQLAVNSHNIDKTRSRKTEIVTAAFI